jgi:hypothetical protein
MCSCAGQQATLVITLQVFWNYNSVAGRRAISAAIQNSLACLDVAFFLAEDNQTDAFDCMNLSGLVLASQGPWGGYCISPGATCTVNT